MSIKDRFTPQGLPLLIGSLPLVDHTEALSWVFDATPEIPLWVQLPKNRGEGMISQFLRGMPGYKEEGDREYIHSSGEGFDEALLAFFEEYLLVQGGGPIEETRFVLDRERAKGFYAFLAYLQGLSAEQRENIVALKGQITGPITFATAVKDEEGRSIFYNLQLRDAAVKHLSLQALYQAQELLKFGYPVIIFLDEPALAGFGSSEFISISKEDVLSAFAEIITPLQEKGVLVGIHICANTDWSLVFDSGADILSFDAYSFFDKLMLFKEPLLEFISSGKMVAWGVVPTEGRFVEKEEIDSLDARYNEQIDKLCSSLEVKKEEVESRLFITPSCGTGSLSPELAKKVLSLTRQLYQRNFA